MGGTSSAARAAPWTVTASSATAVRKWFSPRATGGSTPLCRPVRASVRSTSSIRRAAAARVGATCVNGARSSVVPEVRSRLGDAVSAACTSTGSTSLVRTSASRAAVLVARGVPPIHGSRPAGHHTGPDVSRWARWAARCAVVSWSAAVARWSWTAATRASLRACSASRSCERASHPVTASHPTNSRPSTTSTGSTRVLANRAGRFRRDPSSRSATARHSCCHARHPTWRKTAGSLSSALCERTWHRVDLRDYMRLVRKRWRIISACVLLGLLGAAALTALSPKSYSAQAQVFVSAQATADDLTSALQGSGYTQQRVKSYADIVDTPLVTDPVVKQLNLGISSEELARKISASNPLDTLLLNISVTDNDPEQAAKMANAVAAQFSTVVRQLETPDTSTQAPGTPPQALVKATVVKPANVPTVPVSPRPKINLALGLLV